MSPARNAVARAGSVWANQSPVFPVSANQGPALLGLGQQPAGCVISACPGQGWLFHSEPVPWHWAFVSPSPGHEMWRKIKLVCPNIDTCVPHVSWLSDWISFALISLLKMIVQTIFYMCIVYCNQVTRTRVFCVWCNRFADKDDTCQDLLILLRYNQGRGWDRDTIERQDLRNSSGKWAGNFCVLCTSALMRSRQLQIESGKILLVTK